MRHTFVTLILLFISHHSYFLELAVADVVYEQAPNAPDANYIWSSHYQTDGETSGWRAWETFSLTETATIHKLEWWHASLTFENNIGVPGNVQVDRWVGEIRDVATNGSNFFWRTDLAYNSVDLGVRNWGSGTVQAYANEALIDPITLEVNTDYYISFLSYAESGDPINAWWGSPKGDGVSNQQYYSDSGGFDTFNTRTSDLAFRLTAVPEPATSASTLLLLAAVALRRKNRQPLRH